MHKNGFGAKTLVGNWQEERSTAIFGESQQKSAPYLPGSESSKYLPISKDIGNKKQYVKEKHDDASENWFNF